MVDNITEFLTKLKASSGGNDSGQPPSKWDEIIVPESSYLLTGDVGTGKSALAYYILERYSSQYSLTPVVVGLPSNKRYLLPGNFSFVDSIDDTASIENAIVFIDEADIQLPLDSNKDKERVVNALSLPRQRNQIFILAYHFPRLVKGTYLPFFSAFLFKRPPYLIEFASKRGSDELFQMMSKATERFNELPDSTVKYTYVIAPRIRWQGMLENSLPTFWSPELSKIWSGATYLPTEPVASKIKKMTSSRRRVEATVGVTPPEEPAIVPYVESGYLVGFRIDDPMEQWIKPRNRLIGFLLSEYPKLKEKSVNLADASILYGVYTAEVRLAKPILWG